MVSINTKLLLLSLVVLSLFIAGCTTDNGDRRDINFRTGSQALDVQFLQPGLEEYYEGDQLVVLAEYFNRGTSDIVGGQFYVSGYDPSYMRISPDPAFITIDGKDEYDPTGRNSQVLTLKSTQLRLPENVERYDQTLKLTSCYDYRSEVSVELCIDPDPNGRRVSSKICNMVPASPGAQGAPIVVTYVEPIVSRNDLRLNIEFANQGDGVVFDRRLGNDECFGNLDRYTDANKVDLVNVEFSGRGLYCEPNNPLRLIDGRGKVTCECVGCVNDLMDAFETQISIEFAYGYRNEDIKQVRLLAE